jgi:hypothetical protein
MENEKLREVIKILLDATKEEVSSKMQRVFAEVESLLKYNFYDYRLKDKAIKKLAYNLIIREAKAILLTEQKED